MNKIVLAMYVKREGTCKRKREERTHGHGRMRMIGKERTRDGEEQEANKDGQNSRGSDLGNRSIYIYMKTQEVERV